METVRAITEVAHMLLGFIGVLTMLTLAACLGRLSLWLETRTRMDSVQEDYLRLSIARAMEPTEEAPAWKQ